MNTIETHVKYKNIGQIPASKRGYTYHYQKARLCYIESLRALDPDAYEWELQAAADEKCKPLRKQYEERIERILIPTKVT